MLSKDQTQHTDRFKQHCIINIQTTLHTQHSKTVALPVPFERNKDSSIQEKFSVL